VSALATAVVLVYHVVVSAMLLLRTRAWRRSAAPPTVDAMPAAGGGEVARVDVVVPARNEVSNVEVAVRAVLDQRHVDVHVVVVDDHSDDGTYGVAEGLARHDDRVRVLRALPLPPGWVGKTHAVHQGAAVTDAPWLLFLDADVVLHPEAVATAVGLARERRLDALSVSPFQRAETFVERLVQPVVFALLDEWFPMHEVNDPQSPIAAANGQFLLVRRSAYEAVGGHAAVRAEVLDDVALAHRVKRARLSLFFGTTRDLVTTRMYRHAGALWEGWSKNLFLLLGARGSTAAAIVLRELALWVLPLVTVPAAWWAAPGIAASAAATAALGALLVASAAVVWSSGAPRRYLFLVPFGKLFVVVLIVASWWKHRVSGRVAWKGRVYARLTEER
jgi:chlorobactene glucosyltransferase